MSLISIRLKFLWKRLPCLLKYLLNARVYDWKNLRKAREMSVSAGIVRLRNLNSVGVRLIKGNLLRVS